MKLSKIRTLVSILSIAAVAGVVALAIPANGAGTPDNRYLTVTGVGTISVVPDAVRFNATVSTVAATNALALSSASKSAAAVRAALKDKGIAAKDIRSANISVYPEYTWTQETGTKITGYRGSQTFDVLVRKASDAGAIIEAVVTAGGDNVQLGGVIPTTLNPATATEEARASAVANARSKATSYAKLLGTSLGKVLSLEEQSSPVYSSPYPMAKAEMAADSAAVEVDLGEQDVTVSITVRWALN
jgi:uncharacterized protein YggE